MSSLVSLRLARLIAIVDDRLLFQKMLSEVRQMRQWVLDAEHILSAEFLEDRIGRHQQARGTTL